MTNWSEIESLARRNKEIKKPLAEWKTKYQEARPRGAELLLYWDKLVVQDLSRVAEATWGDNFVISKVNENWQELVDHINIDRFVVGQINMQEIMFRWAAYGPGACYDVLVYFKNFSPTKIIVQGKTALTTSKANENELKKVLLLAFEAGPRDI
jgi:hypothetical protein